MQTVALLQKLTLVIKEPPISNVPFFGKCHSPITIYPLSCSIQKSLVSTTLPK